MWVDAPTKWMGVGGEDHKQERKWGRGVEKEEEGEATPAAAGERDIEREGEGER